MLISRFQTVLCDTNAARDIHFQIRYMVFCEQTRFEDPSAFPSGREDDVYDEFATHFLLWDRFQRRWIGAMRLIDAKRTCLPSEAICGSTLKDLDLYRDRSVEFSRLSVLGECPRDAATTAARFQGQPLVETSDSHQISFNHEKSEAFLWLLWASFEWGSQNGIDFFFAIITAPLARMLKRFGIPLTVVGTEVRHRGVRRPYRCNVHESRDELTRALPEFARVALNARAFVPYSELRFQSRLGTAPGSAVVPLRECR